MTAHLDRTPTPKHDFPPNVPEKLIAKFRECKNNMSRLARRLEINKGHIHNLLVEGKEPKDKKLRKKLFLPAKSREGVPTWVTEAADNIARLEQAAQPSQNRTYNRKGKRVR